MDSDDDVIKVHSFDGQTVWYDRNTSLYEVGHYLGGGAAGTVYECEHVKTRERYALKILNPLGYKLLSPPLLRRCTVTYKGKVTPDVVERMKEPFIPDHVWWLLNGSTKQYIAAYYSERHNSLREFSLNQCIQLWGKDPRSVGDDENGERDSTTEIIQLNGSKIYVPSVPPKYADFVRKRRRIFREIKNMRKISAHINIIRLENVLELIQESKCTIFLVMELANGGELFDRIKIDCGTREDTAKFFFQQLLLGVKHCHDQGVCHRDLKPENLLLQDSVDQSTILKIADFGFSARFAMGSSSENNNDMKSPQPTNISAMRQLSYNRTSVADESPLRMLKSVVGSPFYVAPEVLQARGYDGPKADMWSLGVILYAMLAGNLPFEQDLSSCKRFRLFCKWVREQTEKGKRFTVDSDIEYPPWLFPAKFSTLAKGLIVSMLHPDPSKRISVEDSMKHPLLSPTATESVNSTLPSTLEQNRSNDSLDSLSKSQSPSKMETKREQNEQTNAEPSLSYRVGTIDESISHSNDAMISTEVIEMATENLTLNSTDASLNVPPNDTSESNCIIEADPVIDESTPSQSNDMPIHLFRAYPDDDKPSDEPSKTYVNTFPMHNLMDIVHEDEDDENVDDDDESNGEDDDDSEPILFSMEEDTPMDREDSVIQTATCINPTTTATAEFSYSPSYNVTINYRCAKFLGMPESPSTPDAPLTHMSDSPSSRCPNNAGAPPLLPSLSNMPSFDDLLDVNDDTEVLNRGGSKGSASVNCTDSPQSNSNHNTSRTVNPPSFNDVVKRSTRFITAVPAIEVLTKVDSILTTQRLNRLPTPIGIIGKVVLNWNDYRLEVWGLDVNGPPLCALQLYEMPASATCTSFANSPATASTRRRTTSNADNTNDRAVPFVGYFPDMLPSPIASSPQRSGKFLSSALSSGIVGMTAEGKLERTSFPLGIEDSDDYDPAPPFQRLFLVEFVRVQLEIFAFKRFYQWVRQRVSEMVKRDYSDTASSPMVDSRLMSRIQYESNMQDRFS